MGTPPPQDFVYPVPGIYVGYRIYHLPPHINYIIIKIFKRFIKLDKFIYSNNLFFWEMKTHTKDKKESKFLIQKQLKTAMATFKVTTYYNNLKNDKFSISFVYFPSNENGWKPKGFFFGRNIEIWKPKVTQYKVCRDKRVNYMQALLILCSGATIHRIHIRCNT